MKAVQEARAFAVFFEKYLLFFIFFESARSLACFEQSLCQILNPPRKHHRPPRSPAPPTDSPPRSKKGAESPAARGVQASGGERG